MYGEAGACAPSWSHAWRAVAWNDRFCSRSRTSDAARSRDQGGDGKTDGGTHLAVVVARPHRGEQQRHGGAARDRKSTRLNPVTNAHLVCSLLLANTNTTNCYNTKHKKKNHYNTTRT